MELTGGSSFDAISYLRSQNFAFFLPSSLLTSILAIDFSVPSTLAFASTLPSLFISVLQNVLASDEYKLLETLATPVLVLFGTEVLVDWLKHAFITKFNQIKPTVYGRFRDSLCRDLAGGRVRGAGGKDDDVERRRLVSIFFVVFGSNSFVECMLI